MRTLRNTDSRKNAKIPSAARGAPNMSPTNREYSDQFVPNENSKTIPVAAPTTKTSPKILIRKFDRFL